MDERKVTPETTPLEPDQTEGPTVVGPDGKPTPAKWLTLGIERFNHPTKHYRLIWIHLGQAWFAEEDTTYFTRKYGEGGAVRAGQVLAERVKCLQFNEATR
ncbi:MAG: hypothetical protein BroJett011_03770 [Chloroflexota bacterium]|nr:MAG: hypothetical protein BroJett011_03770 [Chloroflexota bacterium]